MTTSQDLIQFLNNNDFANHKENLPILIEDYFTTLKEKSNQRVIKYRHIQTGLFLTKRNVRSSSKYYLTNKGTVWRTHCLKNLSLIKYIDDTSKKFDINEFEKTEFILIEV